MKRRKGFFALVLAGILAFSVPYTSFAYKTPETVSVGLETVCKDAASASIGGTSLLLGNVRNGRFYESGMITSTGGFTVKPVRGNYVMLQDSMPQEKAKDTVLQLKSRGMDAFLGYAGEEGWTLYVANASLSQVQEKSGCRAIPISGFSGIQVDCGQKGSLLISDDTMYAFGGCEKENTFSINGKRYRGYLKFAKKGNTMTAVNIVDLEQYLCGVVPAEMPPSYHAEALKAQALAARTYAMTKLGAHESSGYQLCDTTSCQVYKGYGGEQPSTNLAVRETEGQVICYEGVPIEAVFSASSGGYTENSENVWNTKVPYLRAVPDVEEYGNNTWTRTFTTEDMNRIAAAKSPNIGEVRDIKITKLSTGGRVQELEIVGTKGSTKLTKENIRTYFSPAGGSLSSKLFTINGKGGTPSTPVQGQKTERAVSVSGLSGAMAQKGITAKTEGTLASMNGIHYEVEQDAAGNKPTSAVQGSYTVYDSNISTANGKGVFVIEGRGRGHGVGFSQQGAQGMALKGYTYKDIIAHYYSGVTIEG